MICTKIQTINLEEMLKEINGELEMFPFEELPEENPRDFIKFLNSHNYLDSEFLNRRRVHYGLIYYLKKLGDKSYRDAAFEQFFHSQEYRGACFYFIRRTMLNKIDPIIQTLHKISRYRSNDDN